MVMEGLVLPEALIVTFFKLYAVDTHVSLNAGATKNEVLNAIKGHILAEGQLMGRYSR
jgi:phosphatidylethanolamine-binding protein (PEBP) family uncharacterized protein